MIGACLTFWVNAYTDAEEEEEEEKIPRRSRACSQYPPCLPPFAALPPHWSTAAALPSHWPSIPAVPASHWPTPAMPPSHCPPTPAAAVAPVVPK